MYIVHLHRGAEGSLSQETQAFVAKVFDDNTVTFLDR